MMQNNLKITWVKIPAGAFLYSEYRAMEIRDIERDYLIAKTPITYAQYKLFLNANPSQPVPEDWDVNTRSFKSKYENHPVVYIAYQDAEAFCKWAGCRLPTEEEWEKAARGDNGNIYPWGDKMKPNCANHNKRGIKRFGTTPVGQYPDGASPYGLLDMAGNVYEWTTGWYNQDRTMRVARGGYWGNGPFYVRAAFRKNFYPHYKSPAVGIRPVKDIP